MSRILCFGELLLRLSSPEYNRLFQKESLETSFCGSEANVAVALANYGEDVKYVTTLPKNDIGISAYRDLLRFGIDLSGVQFEDGRMGTFYMEKGVAQRPSKVIYDRKYSAFYFADKNSYVWENLFIDVEWFHFSGITTALSSSLAEICCEACKKAKEYGIMVSCDLNYRTSLWDESSAQRTMAEIMPYVDVCIGNEEDTEKMLGIKKKNSCVSDAKLEVEDYLSSAIEICDKYGCKHVAFSLRESYNASVNGWSGLVYSAEQEKLVCGKHFDIHIVDRVGAGDSFAAGIIYGLKNGKSLDYTVDFAVASSCLNHTLMNDYNLVNTDEIEKLMFQGDNGRIER